MNPFSSGSPGPFGGRGRLQPSSLALSRLALVLALALLAVVSVRAGTAHRVATAAPSVDPAPTPEGIPERPGAPSSDAPLDPGVLEQAARQAPFHPEREAPAGRYRLLSERRAEAPPPPPPVIQEEAPVPAFQLHGVVAMAGEGAPLVILSVDGNAPMVLSEGDVMAGYQVAQVVGTSALLTGEGRNLRVSVADPSPEGPMVAVEDPRGRGQPQPRGNTAQQQRALQQAVEARARELQQQLGDRGVVRVDGDRITVVGPDGRNMMIQRITAPQARPGGGE